MRLCRHCKYNFKPKTSAMVYCSNKCRNKEKSKLNQEATRSLRIKKIKKSLSKTKESDWCDYTGFC